MQAGRIPSPPRTGFARLSYLSSSISMWKIRTPSSLNPPRKRKLRLYLSHPRRVFDRYGHIRLIPAGFSIAVAIFVTSPPGFRQIWPYSSNPRRVLREYGHIHPILGGFSVNMAIFVQFLPGFAWHWSYSSNPRRVFGKNSHIHPILGGFCMKMAIFVQSPPGFTCTHTNFKSDSPVFAWYRTHPPNSRRVFRKYGHIRPIPAGFYMHAYKF